MFEFKLSLRYMKVQARRKRFVAWEQECLERPFPPLPLLKHTLWVDLC